MMQKALLVCSGVQSTASPCISSRSHLSGQFRMTLKLCGWGPVAPRLSRCALSLGYLHIRRPCGDTALTVP